MKTVKFYSIHKVKTSDAERKEIIERVFKINTNKLNLVVDSEEPDYIITDTGIYRYERCWKEFRKYYSPKRIHILFVDEATFPDMNLFDYACVMNSHFSIDDRVCKIPNDFFYSNKIMLTSDNSLYGAGKQKCKEELEKKTGFCNFLYSNPNAHPNRDALFYSLNCYKNVDAIGSHLRNVGGGEWR